MDLKSEAPRNRIIIINWILILLFCVTIPIQAMESRKLVEEKCTPCGDTPSSPPPSIVYPSPPPPSIVYPSPPPPSPSPPPPVVYYSPPPPPSPKKPPSVYCPPPPPSSSSSYQYITGPPGNLYPVVENFNGGATPNCPRSFTVFLPLLFVLLSLLAL